ncbi:MAG: GerMN domain-containing protein [bacterium]
MRPVPTIEPRLAWLVVFGALGLVVLGGGIWWALQREGPVEVTTSVEQELTGTRTIDLYFPAAGGGIERESREIVGGELLEDDVRRTIDELIHGGESGVRPIPPATRLLNVFYDGDGEVTLSFTDHLRTDHPGGSEAEIATLECLVATIGANFAGVDQVRILIEGEEAVTLAGHADLRNPLRVEEYR